jgi:hypothetical protein
MYREEDLKAILDNIDKITDKAKDKKLETLDPKRKEIHEIYKIIKEFIKKKNRIIYGGYAQNALIKKKKLDDMFYKEVDMPDIEFYSPEPIKDLFELCDILYKKNYPHVEGREGVHNETYKIFVNFKDGGYCDITYMPKNIYDNMRTSEIEGMRMIHPYFIYTDAYRVYTDPITSYYRLQKAFNRFEMLMKHYPIESSEKYNNLKYTFDMDKKLNEEILRFMRKKIFQNNNSLIVIGHYAYNQLLKIAGHDKYLINNPFYQCISINYKEDIKKIFDILKQEYGDKITFKEYTHFFQFTDKKINFYYDKQLILQVYGNNERCITYRYSEKKLTNFGTFQLIVLYFLINYNHAIVKRDKFDENMYLKLLSHVFYTRNKYLSKTKKTVLDKTVFEEFTINCIGVPSDQLRESRLEGLRRRQKKLPSLFIYKPSNRDTKPPDYKFRNSSGNEIFNEKNFTIQK